MVWSEIYLNLAKPTIPRQAFLGRFRGGGAPCGKSVYQRHMGLTGINEHCSCNGKNTECGKGGIGVGEIYGHFDEQVGITEIVHQFFFSYSYNLLTT